MPRLLFFQSNKQRLNGTWATSAYSVRQRVRGQTGPAAIHLSWILEPRSGFGVCDFTAGIVLNNLYRIHPSELTVDVAAIQYEKADCLIFGVVDSSWFISDLKASERRVVWRQIWLVFKNWGFHWSIWIAKKIDLTNGDWVFGSTMNKSPRIIQVVNDCWIWR